MYEVSFSHIMVCGLGAINSKHLFRPHLFDVPANLLLVQCGWNLVYCDSYKALRLKIIFDSNKMVSYLLKQL